MFKNDVVGTIVLTGYNNHTYRIDDVDFSSNPGTEFEMKDHKISFAKYYWERYHLKVTEMTQPLLVSRPKDKDRRGGRLDDIRLIPEFCRRTGIHNFKTVSTVFAHMYL